MDWTWAHGVPDAVGRASADFMSRLPSLAAGESPQAMAFTRLTPEGKVRPFLPAAPFMVDVLAGPEEIHDSAYSAMEELCGTMFEDPGDGGAPKA